MNRMVIAICTALLAAGCWPGLGNASGPKDRTDPSGNAAVTHSAKRVPCPYKHCAMKMQGYGKLQFHPFTGSGPSFLAGQHFRIKYKYACGPSAGKFTLTIWTYYGGEWQFDIPADVSGLSGGASVNEDQPASLRWYPQVDSSCWWSFSVIKLTA